MVRPCTSYSPAEKGALVGFSSTLLLSTVAGVASLILREQYGAWRYVLVGSSATALLSTTFIVHIAKERTTKPDPTHPLPPKPFVNTCTGLGRPVEEIPPHVLVKWSCCRSGGEDGRYVKDQWTRIGETCTCCRNDLPPHEIEAVKRVLGTITDREVNAFLSSLIQQRPHLNEEGIDFIHPGAIPAKWRVRLPDGQVECLIRIHQYWEHKEKRGLSLDPNAIRYPDGFVDDLLCRKVSTQDKAEWETFLLSPDEDALQTEFEGRVDGILDVATRLAQGVAPQLDTWFDALPPDEQVFFGSLPVGDTYLGDLVYRTPEPKWALPLAQLWQQLQTEDKLYSPEIQALIDK